MIGELIPTGVTYGVGRVSLNTQFSGTADFNNVEVSGNLSAGTGGAIYSGGTDLYNIFGTGSALNLWLSGTGANAIIQDGGSNIASGTSSVAEGASNVAGGDYSHAEGNQTQAIGLYSHSEGQFTTAIGNYSHAEGRGSDAFGSVSHAEGLQTVASGQASHAEGGFTTANGDYSHAEGLQTIAVGDYSHSEGLGTISSGISSHAEGDQTTSFGLASHSEGISTTAIGLYSHSEGESTMAIGQSSHAEGRLTTASEPYSHAEGFSTTASGTSSHAEGRSTKTFGPNSHAEGFSTTAIGTSSHAEGFTTIAIGSNSHAGGSGSTAVGAQSFVHGVSSMAIGDNTIVLGNDITGTTANTIYVANLNIDSAPSNDNALTQLLVRATDGTIKYRDSSSFVSSSGNTFVDLGNTYTYKVSGNSASFEQISLSTNFSPGFPAYVYVGRGVSQLASDSGLTVVGEFRSEAGSIRMRRLVGGGDQRLDFTSSGNQMLVQDNVNLRGLEYLSNYHSNYTTRSIVDKEYVDNAISTATTSSVGINPYLNLGTTGTTITWNVSGLSTNYEVTLSAATTLNLTNVRNGEYGTIIVTQDAVGGRAITLGTVNGAGATHRVAGGGAGSIVLTSNANAIDILTFTYNGSAMYWTVGNDYT